MENWKAVKGYEGLYEVSDLGRVKGLLREMKHPKRAGVITIQEKIIKPYADKGGYMNLTLWVSGSKKRHRVHQIVAVAFLGHTVDGFTAVVNHKDFDRSNNKADNLEITTQRKNADQFHLPSESKYIGVTSSGSKWKASIYYNKRTIYLGTYTTEIEASEAYKAALDEIELKEILGC